MSVTEQPLAGTRVIDLADAQGELVGRLLADLGAEVIRVEPPEGGTSRGHAPFHDGDSLAFGYRNAGKRGLVLDLSNEADRSTLDGLLTSSDVLIESGVPGELAGLGLAPADLCARHPHLVLLSFSSFGSFGPYRGWLATDPVLSAMGGVMAKAGIPEKAPLVPPSNLAGDIASVSATFAVACALLQRASTGAGQHIDFSALLGVAQTTDWAYSNASITLKAGADLAETRAGSGPVYTIYRCKGGYVRLVVLSARQWRALWEWMGEPEEFADPHWEQFINRLMAADVLTPAYEAHFAKMTMEEVSAEAQRRGIVCTPVLRPEEVLANEHLSSRGTFVETELVEGVSAPMASGFLEMDGVRQGPKTRAPRIGEHSEAVRQASEAARPAPAKIPSPSAPLAGLRVLDFGIGGVGVECARLFADYGADVVRIESRTYPDFIRTITGSEMSTSFASSSRSKRSFGVNLKDPEGRALVHELAKQADMVIENSSTGTMDDMGVGYEALRAVNPGIVFISSQLLGSHGAWADWIGYGPSTQPFGGLVHLWNYEDQDFPAGSTSIFPDHLAGRVSALTAVAGLIRRTRTGQGGHGEVAQIESVTGMLGELLWKAAFEPGSVKPRGNRSDRGAPWNAYPCSGEDQWCVITVRDDSDWTALKNVLGKPEWAANSAFDTAAGRHAAHDEIDAELGAWTRARDKFAVAEALQAAGIPCGPMLTAGEQTGDPHFQAWEYGHTIHQPELLVPFDLEGPCFRATGMTEVVTTRAPQLGEHTEQIARELLGLSEAEITRLLAAGVLEGPPPAD
jgi:crotonobetainyl-CoA:carnitine CoA-transferase CaiB-like acyl-CoA transferase